MLGKNDLKEIVDNGFKVNLKKNNGFMVNLKKKYGVCEKWC